MDFYRQLRAVVTTLFVGTTLCTIALMDYQRVNTSVLIHNFRLCLPAVVLGAITALLWFPFSTRFSLRTLLIATTLVAVLLGLGIWLAR